MNFFGTAPLVTCIKYSKESKGIIIRICSHQSERYRWLFILSWHLQCAPLESNFEGFSVSQSQSLRALDLSTYRLYGFGFLITFPLSSDHQYETTSRLATWMFSTSPCVLAVDMAIIYRKQLWQELMLSADGAAATKTSPTIALACRSAVISSIIDQTGQTSREYPRLHYISFHLLLVACGKLFFVHKVPSPPLPQWKYGAPWGRSEMKMMAHRGMSRGAFA